MHQHVNIKCGLELMKLLQHIFVIQNIIDFTTLLYCSYQIGFFNDLLKKQESKILYFGCYS